MPSWIGIEALHYPLKKTFNRPGIKRSIIENGLLGYDENIKLKLCHHVVSAPIIVWNIGDLTLEVLSESIIRLPQNSCNPDPSSTVHVISNLSPLPVAYYSSES